MGVTVVNYGLGNILAFLNVYSRMNIPVQIASKKEDLARAQKLVLPGVGSFDWAMSQLRDSGMREELDELVLKRKVPVLGVCVGMQLMANASEEGQLPGLGWIPGKVRRFSEGMLKTKTPLPHMGWNTVTPKEHPLFVGIDRPEYYFLHSYFFEPESADYVLAETEYGIPFASAVSLANVLGVQFHPEKSHNWGAQLLRNFAAL